MSYSKRITQKIQEIQSLKGPLGTKVSKSLAIETLRYQGFLPRQKRNSSTEIVSELREIITPINMQKAIE